jgi:hypothetical protein
VVNIAQRPPVCWASSDSLLGFSQLAALHGLYRIVIPLQTQIMPSISVVESLGAFDCALRLPPRQTAAFVVMGGLMAAFNATS